MPFFETKKSTRRATYWRHDGRVVLSFRQGFCQAFLDAVPELG